MKLSGIILTRNNEVGINKLIKSMRFCDEVIVVDDNSDDKTGAMAKKAGARVLIRAVNSDFSAQRNFGLSKARGEWVLFVDSDEMVSEKLGKEVIRSINSDNYDGYMIKREDVFMGKTLRYGETGQMWLVRLARKDAGRWRRPVHEEWILNQKSNSKDQRAENNIGRLKNALIHKSHKTVVGFINKIITYSQIEAEYRVSLGVRVRWWEMIVYPWGKFVVNYIVKLGFLDGMQGFIMAEMMSIHSFLVRIFWYEKSR